MLPGLIHLVAGGKGPSSYTTMAISYNRIESIFFLGAVVTKTVVASVMIVFVYGD